MVEQNEQRRLAAILAGDMIGYSRLMEVGERGWVLASTFKTRRLKSPALLAMGFLW